MGTQTMNYTTILNFFCTLFLAGCVFVSSTLAADAGDQQITILSGVTIIDATGQAPLENVNLIISGNQITGISKELPTDIKDQSDVRTIDLKGKYVLPGLWNNHSHLGDLLPDSKNTLEDEPLLRASIRAGRNAMDALRAGFTSLRVVGERDYIDVAWKNAFDSGVFVGPRIYPSGAPLTDADSDDWLGQPIDGPEEMRIAVRQHVANGAQIVKIIADNLSEDEIEAAIDEAHEQGVKITAHSGGQKSYLAVKHNVDGIEHGNQLSDETISMMVQKNVFLDPTMVCNLSAEYIAEREEIISAAGYNAEKRIAEGRVLVAFADERSKQSAQIARETLVRAAKAGVKIISGSDSNPIDEIGILEIEQLVFSGLTPMQAIQAATINSAQMMGVDDELGTIEVGKLADLIVLNKNPLEHISNLRSIERVMKDGHFVNLEVNEGRKSFWDLYFLTD